MESQGKRERGLADSMVEEIPPLMGCPALRFFRMELLPSCKTNIQGNSYEEYIHFPHLLLSMNFYPTEVP